MEKSYFTVPERQRGVRPVRLPDTDRKGLSIPKPLVEEWRHGKGQDIPSALTEYT
jgi:hypothetical protein